MKQTKKIETKERVNPLQLLKDGLLKDENLRWALIQGTGIFVTVRIIQVNLYQPILLDKGFSVASLGLIMSAMTVAESFGSKFTGEFSEKFGLIRGSFLSILAVCISMISFAYSISYLAIVNFIVFSFFIGISMPLARQILNDNIKTSEARATVLSFESLFNRLLSAAVTMPIAYLISSQHVPLYFYNICSGSNSCLCRLHTPRYKRAKKLSFFCSILYQNIDLQRQPTTRYKLSVLLFH